MEDKVRFIPLIVDYPERITTRVLTDEQKKMVNELGDKMRDMMEQYNVHMNINNYIYLPLSKDGVRIDKSLRIKVDGPIYNQIKAACGGELPRRMEILEAKKLDSNEIY